MAPFVVAGLGICATTLAARSQERVRRQADEGAVTSEVKIEVKEGFRCIDSNGIPDHSTGQFPNRNNPNRIAPQSYHFRVPVEPKPASSGQPAQLFGVALNGVVFEPGTAEMWNGDFRWRYEALTGLFGGRGKLGADDSLAHVQPNGAYHYHGLPMGFLNKRDYKNKMTLIGYAADGYPIYGPYVYSDNKDPKSPLKMVRSGYRIKNGDRPGGESGPGGAYDGSFASDYEFVKGNSELDEYNGRTGVTPEYPEGTFYYVLTDNWPFIPRKFRGTPDPSFRKGPGGAGGPGGRPGRPGGFGRPGGPPPFPPPPFPPQE